MKQIVTIDISGTSTTVEINLDDALVQDLMDHIQAVIDAWMDKDSYIAAPIKYSPPDPKLVEEYLKKIQAGRPLFSLEKYQSDQRWRQLPE